MVGWWVLAVDLGTTNTVAAWADEDSAPQVLSLNGSTIHPSAVFLTAEGGWLYGASGRNAAHTDPGRFEPTPKRRIADGQVLLGARLVPVVELLAAVLRPLFNEAARQHGGQPPARLVLTHPASWSEARITMLRQAAWDASPPGEAWPGADTLPEPVAAAWNAGATAHLPADARIAVFDVGGGTLDVAVVDRTVVGGRPSVTVVGRPDALDPLGGEDFDLWLASTLAQDAGAPGALERLQSSGSPADRLTLLDLRRSARDAKEALSTEPAVPAHVPALPPDLPQSATVQVQRRSFEALIRGDKDRVGLKHGVDLLRAAVDGAPPGPPFVGVFMIGGSSRIPLLGELLAAQNFTPLEHGDPSTAVAMGAIRYAQGVLLAPDPVVETPGPAVPGLPGPGPGPAPGPLPPPATPWYRKPALAGTTLAVLLGALVLGIVLTQGKSPSSGGGGLPSPSYTCPDGEVVGYSFECPTPEPDPSKTCADGSVVTADSSCPSPPDKSPIWTPGNQNLAAQFPYIGAHLDTCEPGNLYSGYVAHVNCSDATASGVFTGFITFSSPSLAIDEIDTTATTDAPAQSVPWGSTTLYCVYSAYNEFSDGSTAAETECAYEGLPYVFYYDTTPVDTTDASIQAAKDDTRSRYQNTSVPSAPAAP